MYLSQTVGSIYGHVIAAAGDGMVGEEDARNIRRNHFLDHHSHRYHHLLARVPGVQDNYGNINTDGVRMSEGTISWTITPTGTTTVPSVTKIKHIMLGRLTEPFPVSPLPLVPQLLGHSAWCTRYSNINTHRVGTIRPTEHFLYHHFNMVPGLPG